MIVNFRQGVVSYPLSFLTKVGTPTGTYVALNIPADQPLTLHFAHKGTNYIVVQKTSVGLTPPTGAFGPFLAGIDAWLFADIDLTTGIVSWSSTGLEPVNQATVPASTQTIISDAFPAGELVQQAGRHWFKTAPVGGADDVTWPPYQMYLRNAGNTVWEPRVRVFLAKYENAANFISVSINASNPNAGIKFSGTQIGNVTQNSAGFLIYNADNTAFKNTDGTFVTTENVIKTGMLLGADLKVGNNVISATAGATLVGDTVVRFSDWGKVVPVNLFNLDQSFFGFVEAPASMGAQVQVILEGIVSNGAWSWSAPNVPIYADNSGLLTETRPSINDANPVAYALTATSVVLRASRVEVGLVDHASDTMFGAVRLDAVPDAVEGYLDVNYSPLVGDTPGGTVGSSTGLSVTNTYTAQLNIDGIQRDIIYGPSDMPGFPLTTVPTITDLLTFLNTTTPGSGGLMGVATASLDSATALRITSDSAGPLSQVRLTSGSAVVPNLDLFENIVGYAAIGTPVDGYYDSVAAGAASLATHIADMDVHLSVDQNSLLDALDAAAAGIVVKTGAGTMASRSVATAAVGRITVADGDGVAGDPTVDLALVADSGSGSFLKLTRDGWGRVTGTQAVVASDITALVDADYVNVTGDTMTGALVLAAGTAGAPALSFTGDLTKGMYDSGAGEISFAIAGAQKVKIDAGGITTFSGYATSTAGMALWSTTSPTTGVSFPSPGVMNIMVGGLPVATFGGAPGPLSALVAGDIGSTVQAELGFTPADIAGDTFTGDVTVQGTVVGYKDNATSLRVRGPSSTNDPAAGADVQSYAGIFYNAAYTNVGTLETRFITGGNLEMDVALQGPHQVQIAAVDDTQADGQVWVASKTDVVFNMRADAEVASPKQLVLDRVSTGTTGAANTSDVKMDVSGGGGLEIAAPTMFTAPATFSVAMIPPAVPFGGLPPVVPGGVLFVFDATDGAAHAPGALCFGDTGGAAWISTATYLPVAA